MATISQLREQFDGMPIAQKRQFIVSLKNQLKDSTNPEYNKFLQECIIKYNTQAGTGAQSAAASYPRTPPYSQGVQRSSHASIAVGGFTERLHSFGGSTLFLVGAILYSSGSLFNIFIAFNALSFLSLLLLALPVTAFWLIYAASKSPKQPEKTLPALTLLKVSTIVNLVSSGLVALVLLIVTVAAFRLSAGLGMLALVATGAVVAYTVIYFRAILLILSGIKNNIVANSFSPLQSVNLFSIITYIEIGCTVLGTIIAAAALSYMNSIVGSYLALLPNELQMFIPSMGGSELSILFTLASNAGIVLFIIVLNQLNNSLKNN